MKAVFDSDVLIDFLQGVADAESELSSYRSKDRCISVVSWMELMAGAKNADDAETLREFLKSFHMLPLTELVAERAVILRRDHRVKLPDAIIWASAVEYGAVLITRNTKDFPAQETTIRFPYTV